MLKKVRLSQQQPAELSLRVMDVMEEPGIPVNPVGSARKSSRLPVLSQKQTRQMQSKAKVYAIP